MVGEGGAAPMGHQVQGTPNPPNPGGLQENAGHLPDGVSEARSHASFEAMYIHVTPPPITMLCVPLLCQSSKNWVVAVLD